MYTSEQHQADRSQPGTYYVTHSDRLYHPAGGAAAPTGETLVGRLEAHQAHAHHHHHHHLHHSHSLNGNNNHHHHHHHQQQQHLSSDSSLGSHSAPFLLAGGGGLRICPRRMGSLFRFCFSRKFLLLACVLIISSLFILVIGLNVYLNLLLQASKSQLAPLSGRFRVESAGDQFVVELANKTSKQFLFKQHQYETILRGALDRSAPLLKSFPNHLVKLEVYHFRPGSLWVYFRLFLNKRTLQQDGALMKRKSSDEQMERQFLPRLTQQALHSGFEQLMITFGKGGTSPTSGSTESPASSSSSGSSSRAARAAEMRRLARQQIITGSRTTGDGAGSSQQQTGSSNLNSTPQSIVRSFDEQMHKLMPIVEALDLQTIQVSAEFDMLQAATPTPLGGTSDKLRALQAAELAAPNSAIMVATGPRQQSRTGAPIEQPQAATGQVTTTTTTPPSPSSSSEPSASSKPTSGVTNSSEDELSVSTKKFTLFGYKDSPNRVQSASSSTPAAELAVASSSPTPPVLLQPQQQKPSSTSSTPINVSSVEPAPADDRSAFLVKLKQSKPSLSTSGSPQTSPRPATVSPSAAAASQTIREISSSRHQQHSSTTPSPLRQKVIQLVSGQPVVSQNPHPITSSNLAASLPATPLFGQLPSKGSREPLGISTNNGSQVLANWQTVAPYQKQSVPGVVQTPPNDQRIQMSIQDMWNNVLAERVTARNETGSGDQSRRIITISSSSSSSGSPSSSQSEITNGRGRQSDATSGSSFQPVTVSVTASPEISASPATNNDADQEPSVSILSSDVSDTIRATLAAGNDEKPPSSSTNKPPKVSPHLRHAGSIITSSSSRATLEPDSAILLNKELANANSSSSVSFVVTSAPVSRTRTGPKQSRKPLVSQDIVRSASPVSSTALPIPSNSSSTTTTLSDKLATVTGSPTRSTTTSISLTLPAVDSATGSPAPKKKVQHKQQSSSLRPPKQQQQQQQQQQQTSNKPTRLQQQLAVRSNSSRPLPTSSTATKPVDLSTAKLLDQRLPVAERTRDVFHFGADQMAPTQPSTILELTRASFTSSTSGAPISSSTTTPTTPITQSQPRARLVTEIPSAVSSSTPVPFEAAADFESGQSSSGSSISSSTVAPPTTASNPPSSTQSTNFASNAMVSPFAGSQLTRPGTSSFSNQWQPLPVADSPSRGLSRPPSGSQSPFEMPANPILAPPSGGQLIRSHHRSSSPGGRPRPISASISGSRQPTASGPSSNGFSSSSSLSSSSASSSQLSQASSFHSASSGGGPQGVPGGPSQTGNDFESHRVSRMRHLEAAEQQSSTSASTSASTSPTDPTGRIVDDFVITTVSAAGSPEAGSRSSTLLPPLLLSGIHHLDPTANFLAAESTGPRRTRGPFAFETVSESLASVSSSSPPLDINPRPQRSPLGRPGGVDQNLLLRKRLFADSPSSPLTEVAPTQFEGSHRHHDVGSSDEHDDLFATSTSTRPSIVEPSLVEVVVPERNFGNRNSPINSRNQHSQQVLGQSAIRCQYYGCRAKGAPSRWVCLNETQICDDFIDCFDESDELDCVSLLKYDKQSSRLSFSNGRGIVYLNRKGSLAPMCVDELPEADFLENASEQESSQNNLTTNSFKAARQVDHAKRHRELIRQINTIGQYACSLQSFSRLVSVKINHHDLVDGLSQMRTSKMFHTLSIVRGSEPANSARRLSPTSNTYQSGSLDYEVGVTSTMSCPSQRTVFVKCGGFECGQDSFTIMDSHSGGNDNNDDDENGKRKNGVIINDFPWLVKLYWNGLLACHGYLVDELWLISARHCFANRTQVENWTAEISYEHYGNDDYKSIESNRRLISELKLPGHQQSRSPIVLAKLERPVRFSPLNRPVCLPPMGGQSMLGLPSSSDQVSHSQRQTGMHRNCITATLDPFQSSKVPINGSPAPDLLLTKVRLHKAAECWSIISRDNSTNIEPSNLDDRYVCATELSQSTMSQEQNQHELRQMLICATSQASRQRSKWTLVGVQESADNKHLFSLLSSHMDWIVDTMDPKSAAPSKMMPTFTDGQEEANNNSTTNYQTETACSSFRCSSGECLTWSKICDGLYDCSSHDDEKDCHR